MQSRSAHRELRPRGTAGTATGISSRAVRTHAEAARQTNGITHGSNHPHAQDETIASLRKDFDAFLRVSLKLDPQFATPSFEDFLRAKLLDNMVPLTEHAVQRMLQGGQYAWAKRTLDKEFPDVVAILMRQAGEFGFGFAAALGVDAGRV